jgi:hypothetical protein
LVGCKLVQAFWKAVWILLKKLKIKLPYDPVIQLLGIYPKEPKSGYSTDICTLMFIQALFTIDKLWKQPRYSTTDEWIKKMWHKYTMEFYSAIRNNNTMFEGKWMQLEEITLSEVRLCVFSQTRTINPKDKHIYKNKHDHIQTHM